MVTGIAVAAQHVQDTESQLLTLSLGATTSSHLNTTLFDSFTSWTTQSLDHQVLENKLKMAEVSCAMNRRFASARASQSSLPSLNPKSLPHEGWVIEEVSKNSVT